MRRVSKDRRRRSGRTAAAVFTVISPSGLGGTLTPGAVFTQAGTGNQSTKAYVVGTMWDGPWTKQRRYILWSEYVEVDVGRWSTRRGVTTSTAWPTQFGIIPTLRLRSSPESRWFGELGVGPNYIVPLCRSGTKRFSTEFNFGDHVGVGRSFGSARRFESSLRTEHFSNAGIRHPNPGEKFIQARLSTRF
jgi:hypothetical protein